MIAQIGSLLTSNYQLFIVLTAISIFLVAFYLAPTYSTIQSAVDPSARSFAAAVTMFFISGVGMALRSVRLRYAPATCSSPITAQTR